MSSESKHSLDQTTLMMQGAFKMEGMEDAALRSPHMGDGSETVPHNIFMPSADGAAELRQTGRPHHEDAPPATKAKSAAVPASAPCHPQAPAPAPESSPTVMMSDTVQAKAAAPPAPAPGLSQAPALAPGPPPTAMMNDTVIDRSLLDEARQLEEEALAAVRQVASTSAAGMTKVPGTPLHPLLWPAPTTPPRAPVATTPQAPLRRPYSKTSSGSTDKMDITIAMMQSNHQELKTDMHDLRD